MRYDGRVFRRRRRRRRRTRGGGEAASWLAKRL
jgi:hypothetical protein